MLHDRREFFLSDLHFESAKSTVSYLIDRGLRFEDIESIGHFVISIARGQRLKNRTAPAGSRCGSHPPKDQNTGEESNED